MAFELVITYGLAFAIVTTCLFLLIGVVQSRTKNRICPNQAPITIWGQCLDQGVTPSGMAISYPVR
jgi:hypothetical protein